MKHVVASLFHVMMTDRVDVKFFCMARAWLAPCETKNVSGVLFSLFSKESKTHDGRFGNK